jgi:hypothetical protein
MREPGAKSERYPISYFAGVNSTVQHGLAKPQEPEYIENARAPMIGVLEKRAGQTAIDKSFFSDGNYGLIRFLNDDPTSQGIYRISSPFNSSASTSISSSPSTSLSVSASISESPSTSPSRSTSPSSSPSTSLSTSTSPSASPSSGSTGTANIYKLDSNDHWTILADADAQDLVASQFSSTIVNGSLVLVNKYGSNRLIAPDGVTVTTSATAGSLYNSPSSAKTKFYKNRIYMANFLRLGIDYKTTIIRSSIALGIVSLVNGDVVGTATIPVTSTKYLYSASGMNSYDIYRGGTLITTITVSTVNETSVIASAPVTLLSSDEVWIAGTYNGEKQYRWVNNTSAIGIDAKQYDTFKLTGADEDGITMLETIGNILMIANRNTMMSWNDYNLENFDLAIGCASPNGYTKLLGSLYFIHSSGIYSTTGSVPTLISRKVEKFIRGATKAGIENAAAGYKGTSVFFCIGDVTLYNYDGSTWKTMPDVCIEFNAVNQDFYIHTNVPVSEMATFIDAQGNERLLSTQTRSGKYVKEFLSGSTDDGDTIFMRIDTAKIQFQKEFEIFIQPTAVVTEVDRGSQLKCFVSLDEGPFFELEGTMEKGIVILKLRNENDNLVKPPMTRFMRLSFRDSSQQRPRIVQTAIIYYPTTIDIVA